ncbi:MAG: hypothetical protein WAM66_08870 [Acidobacteriaceae bacterium]
MKGFLISLLAALLTLPAAAQVFTVQPEGVAAKYLQFKPTDVKLSTLPMTDHDRQELLRFLQAEQGFSMRPLPVATITLPANGMIKPSGSDYVNLVQKKGIAVEAGKRVVVTDIKIEKNRILLDFNGGPEHKHKWLRHVSIGMDPYDTTPIVHDNPNAPTGTRIELVFPHGLPDLTGMQVEALVKPIVDFSLKTPEQAYTDTLPPFLKKAVLAHHVLVGMNREMVLSTLGEPRTKMHDMENNQSIDIWIYGEPPDPTQFVRFNGGRVIRLEVAAVGKPIVVYVKDEMRGYWSKQPAQNVHIVQLGDQNPADAAKETAKKAPPTLRNPGEALPADKNPDTPQMKPVEFPKDTGGSAPPATTPSQAPSGASQPASTPSGTSQPQPAPQPATQPSSQLAAQLAPDHG